MSRQQQLHGVMAVLRSSQTELTCALRMRQLVLNYTEPPPAGSVVVSGPTVASVARDTDRETGSPTSLSLSVHPK